MLLKEQEGDQKISIKKVYDVYLTDWMSRLQWIGPAHPKLVDRIFRVTTPTWKHLILETFSNVVLGDRLFAVLLCGHFLPVAPCAARKVSWNGRPLTFWIRYWARIVGIFYDLYCYYSTHCFVHTEGSVPWIKRCLGPEDASVPNKLQIAWPTFRRGPLGASMRTSREMQSHSRA